MNLGKAAEKQGHLIDARTQYLAAEHVVYTEDAEKALQRVAEAADQQVRSLMDRAAQAYAAEQFASAAQLLESAGDLHPGSLAIGCNLGLTRYQQGNRDEALALLNECVGAMRDKDTRRQMGELATALGTGDRLSVVSPAARQQVARLNDAILHDVGDEMVRQLVASRSCAAARARNPSARPAIACSRCTWSCCGVVPAIYPPLSLSRPYASCAIRPSASPASGAAGGSTWRSSGPSFARR